MTEQQWLQSTDPAAMVAHLGEWITDGQRRFCVDAFIEMSGTTIGPAITWTAELANELFRMWCTQRNGFIKKVPWSLRADILRDIVGNPFRPIMRFCGGYRRLWAMVPHDGMYYPEKLANAIEFDPEWLTWNDSAIPAMVDMMLFYNLGVPRAEPRWSDMLVIADALEEAGCQEPAILEHLRSDEWCAWCGGQGMTNIKCSLKGKEGRHCSHCNGTGQIKRRHFRGCWCVELLKGGVANHGKEKNQTSN